MPQNLPGQILQRIVKLSADGNSQREVVWMLASRMHKQNFAIQPRDMPTTSEEACRFDKNLHATERPSTAPNGQNEPLHLGSSSANADDLSILEADVSSRRLLATGYWSRRPAKCPRHILEHRRRRREWGRRHRVWDLRQWRHCIFSDESQFSLYHNDGRVQVCRRQGERLIDGCVQPNDGNCGPSVMVWGAIQDGGRSELVVVDGVMNQHWYIKIPRNQMLPWATGVFGCNVVYVQDNAPPHTARDTAAFWTNRMLRS